jgi:hypothetical protein
MADAQGFILGRLSLLNLQPETFPLAGILEFSLEKS